MIIPVRCFTCGKVRLVECVCSLGRRRGEARADLPHSASRPPALQVIGNKYETYARMLMEDKEPGCVRGAGCSEHDEGEAPMKWRRRSPRAAGKRWTTWG
jgi:hypothetical protein